MNIIKRLEAMTQYLTEGFARIFSRQEGEMPDIGVQPYECSPYIDKSRA